MLIPAGHLVSGVSILRCPEVDPLQYFHIELEQHDIIFADGAPAETFVDCDSRCMFHNAREFAGLYPADTSAVWAFCVAAQPPRLPRTTGEPRPLNAGAADALAVIAV